MNKLIAAFFSLICLTSCIGEDFIEVDSAQNERLVIVPQSNRNSDLINVGDSLTYTAEYTNSEGKITTIALTWSSSKPEIATIDQNGKVKALQAGAVNITVNAVGNQNGAPLEDSRLLVVEQLERVELSSDITSLLTGDSLSLIARYYDEEGRQTPATFNWNSSDATVATIDQNGKLRAITTGQTNITAEANGITSRELSIAVLDDSLAPATIEITADTGEIQKGEQLQFRATVKNINGDVLTDEMLQWKSSDQSVMTIDPMGLAEGVEIGSADITAEIGNVVSNVFDVLVSQAVVTSRSGSFRNENGYRVSGNVELRTKANGDLELSFTNFSSQSGPDLAIYLGNNTNSGVEITRLPQLSGSFTEDVPSTIKIDDYDFVLIWCKAVNAAFGSAQLN